MADSREHRHKASILRRMWSDEGLYLGRHGEDLYTLRSWRSDAVKFGKVLCQDCNNVRSQPFDKAYDVYAEFIQSNTTGLTAPGRSTGERSTARTGRNQRAYLDVTR